MEDRRPPRLRKVDLVSTQCLWQLAEPRLEGILGRASDLLEQGLKRDFLLRSVLPKDARQGVGAGSHQELLAAPLEQRGAELRGGLEGLLHLHEPLVRLLEQLPRHVLLLVAAGGLLRLGQLLRQLARALQQLLHHLPLRRLLELTLLIFCCLARRVHGCLGLLRRHGHLLASLPLGLASQLFRVAVLLEEWLDGLHEGLHSGLGNVRLLCELLQYRRLPAHVVVLSERRQLVRANLQPVLQRLEPRCRVFRRRRPELLDVEGFLGEKGARVADAGLRRGGRLLALRDGVPGLLRGQDLQALEEWELGLADLLHGRLDLIDLLRALLHEAFAEHALALVLGGGDHLGQGLQGLVAAALQPLQGLLQRWRRGRKAAFHRALGGLENLLHGLGTRVDLLQRLVRELLVAEPRRRRVRQALELLHLLLGLLDLDLLLPQDFLALGQLLARAGSPPGLRQILLRRVQAALQLADHRCRVRAGLRLPLLDGDDLPGLDARARRLLLLLRASLRGLPQRLHGDLRQVVLREDLPGHAQRLDGLLGGGDLVGHLGHDGRRPPLRRLLLERVHLPLRLVRALLERSEVRGERLLHVLAVPLGIRLLLQEGQRRVR
mmetsp:Transcript_104546/g.291615  ORF Transcript_104546/g.291615 Transcript_104546/m.291615 type:complete len:607 (-) Transcript_104546:1137-2957(-)